MFILPWEKIIYLIMMVKLSYVTNNWIPGKYAESYQYTESFMDN